MTNDVIVEKLSLLIEIHVVKPPWSLFGQFRIVGSCRELVAKIVYTPPTRLNSASASAVCLGHKMGEFMKFCMH